MKDTSEQIKSREGSCATHPARSKPLRPPRMRRGCHDSDAAAAAAGGNMAMKALRGMVNGAMSELSSAVSGNRPTAAAPASAAATREHVMAVKRDYISQPRLSKSVDRPPT